MICQKCGTNNDDAQKFCVSCGTLLPVQPAAPAEETAVFDDTQPHASPPAGAVPSYHPPAQPANMPPPAPKKKGHAGLMIALIALLLVVVAAAVLAVTKPWANGKDETSLTGATTFEGAWSGGTGTDWPGGGLLAKLPKPNFGKVTITSTDEEDGSATAIIHKTAQKDFDDYVGNLKLIGFTRDVETMKPNDSYIKYSAKNSVGEQVTVVFSYIANSITIVIDITP